MRLKSGFTQLDRELLAQLRATPGGRMKDSDLRRRVSASPASVGSALQRIVNRGFAARVKLMSGEIVELTEKGAAEIASGVEGVLS